MKLYDYVMYCSIENRNEFEEDTIRFTVWRFCRKDVCNNDLFDSSCVFGVRERLDHGENVLRFFDSIDELLDFYSSKYGCKFCTVDHYVY